MHKYGRAWYAESHRWSTVGKLSLSTNGSGTSVKPSSSSALDVTGTKRQALLKLINETTLFARRGGVYFLSIGGTLNRYLSNILRWYLGSISGAVRSLWRVDTGTPLFSSPLITLRVVPNIAGTGSPCVITQLRLLLAPGTH